MTLREEVSKLIRERLKDFKVPNTIREALSNDIVSVLEKPSRNKTGATIMTPEASLDADKERREGANINWNKPKVM